MKRKIGRLCMVLGVVLILSAAGLLGYNRWDASRAEKASQEVLGELEQTMQKTGWDAAARFSAFPGEEETSNEIP